MVIFSVLGALGAVAGALAAGYLLGLRAAAAQAAHARALLDETAALLARAQALDAETARQAAAARDVVRALGVGDA